MDNVQVRQDKNTDEYEPSVWRGKEIGAIALSDVLDYLFRLLFVDRFIHLKPVFFSKPQGIKIRKER
jgi:hypothetical protein